MKVYIASDHGGLELKRMVIERLPSIHVGVEIVDLGPAELDSADDYPPYAFRTAESVVGDGGVASDVFGILVCRSGIGMSIAANKVHGADAALCYSVDLARKAREHNNANILVLDADFEHEEPLAIVTAFLETKFDAGRHERRVQQIRQYELKSSQEPLG